jgi:hypothetical protein
MAFGVPHLLEIVVLAPRANTLLAGGRPEIVPLLLSQKSALELHHPRVGEQEGRVIGGDQ